MSFDLRREKQYEVGVSIWNMLQNEVTFDQIEMNMK